MSAAATALRTGAALAGAEARMTVRDTAGIVVPIGLPLIILVANGMQPSTQQVVSAQGHTVLDAFILPSVLAMVAAVVAIVNMPSFVATYRRTGILRTLAVTPIRPGAILGAQVGVSLVQLLLGVAIMLAVAVLAFGARAPADLPRALGVGLLATAAMYAVGMLVAALAPTPSSALAIGLVIFLGSGAAGGMFGPTDAYPEPIALVGSLLPFGAMHEGLQSAWLGSEAPLASLVALAITTVACGAVAGAAFRSR